MRGSGLCRHGDPCNNYEMGVDLREQITLCDVGDIFTIPANNEKSFDQISKGIAHVFSSGAFPISVATTRSVSPRCVAVCRHLGDKKVGIIHFDRHVDTQEIDLDERMHTWPWAIAVEEKLFEKNGWR